MKTSVDISDPLFAEAKKHAAEEGTTLRELIESGLRMVLDERRRRRSKFSLRDESVEGDGLQPEFRGADWSAIRNAAYGERGR